jgi:hypothetical protein
MEEDKAARAVVFGLLRRWSGRPTGSETPGMDLQANTLFTETEIEYRHVGNLLRVADFDVLSASGEVLGTVREDLRSWRRVVPAGVLEGLVSRTLVFLSPSGQTVMRCVRPRYFRMARIELHVPGVGEVIGLHQVSDVRRAKFVIIGRSTLQEGAVVAERPRDRVYSVRDHDGRAVAKVWMTSGQTRGPLTYRLELSETVPERLRVAAIGFIPGLHAARGGPLVPVPARP